MHMLPGSLITASVRDVRRRIIQSYVLRQCPALHEALGRRSANWQHSRRVPIAERDDRKVDVETTGGSISIKQSHVVLIIRRRKCEGEEGRLEDV
jgi:hypothetical protein